MDGKTKVCEIILALLTVLTFGSDAQCNPTPGGVRRFGTNCTSRCHCLNNEQCSTDFGICESGCDYNWTGDGCQYKNIALEESSRHLDNLPGPMENKKFSDLANDRDITTCSVTADANNSNQRSVAPWWAVWLPFDATVRGIRFVTQDSSLKYFPGFIVTVQSGVSKFDHEKKVYHVGNACYTHDTTIPENKIVDVKCNSNLTGNQIRLQLAKKSTQLVLCDFRVYEDCRDRTWGENCQYDCGFCLNLTQCDAQNGSCPSGCELGYKSTPLCNEVCEAGTFGKNCSKKCHENCKNNVCDKENGTCTDGCDAGYTNDSCEERCQDGYFGHNCTFPCGENCLQDPDSFICDNVNGSCLNGCGAGWKGNLCDTVCEAGTFGKNCSMECNENCKNNVCDKENGTCTDGCDAGYKSESCDERCPGGYFGHNCTSPCGKNCLQDPDNLICDNVNGSCLHGCGAGWKGNMCDTDCGTGEWGNDCLRKCGNCLIGSCDKVTGVCSGGCMAGYNNTAMCHQACNNGSYGYNCTKKCGKCNEVTECNKVTGVCEEGCINGYIGDMCFEAESPPGISFPVAGVAGGMSAAVVVGVIVVAVLIFLRRRNQLQANKKSISNNNRIFSPAANTDEADKENRILEVQHVYHNTSGIKTQTSSDGNKSVSSTKEDSNIYSNNPTSGHEVLVSELEAYVKTGLAQQDYFSQQFEQIPYGMQYPASVARRPENIGKNKYKQMYAYDHSRVILKRGANNSESDYINASNIKGTSDGIAYIAAQGPIANSMNDFWRMIWERNIRIIVMVTNLSEEGKVKCEQYWPELNETEQNGNIIVSMESEEIFTEFTKRHLKIYQEESSNRRRNVTQFHYRVWPDKDVPKCPSSLLHFWYQVKKYEKKKSAPWVVHCSAGVGRTGTFIALDNLYDQGTDKGSVDIFKCVSELRAQRVNMVQTKYQYTFLHRIVVEALLLPWKPVHTDMFLSVYAELKEVDKSTRKTKLLLQFESLNEGSEVEHGQDSQDDIYTSAKTAENRHKNRYDNILAPDEFRPFLYTQVAGCTNYINAVYIPGYREKNAFIITQTPLKITAVDCCRLIIEEEISVVVTFQDNDEDEVGVFLPDAGVLKTGPFSIVFRFEENRRDVMLRHFEIGFQAKKHALTQVIFKSWLTSKLTPDPTDMLYFLQELEQLRRENECKPILVHCLNGAERSGLVTVLMNLLERLRCDDEVSITQVIRQLKIRRQQIIPNFEQFKFCHDVLQAHIQSNSTYANM